MFGTYFYHQISRKMVVAFGTLFNNIEVRRTNSSDEVVESLKIPLSYGPKDKMLGGLWEFPGGKIEKGESKQAAVIREIFEETCLSINNPKYLGEVRHQYSHFKVKISLFQHHKKDISSLKIKEKYLWTSIEGLNSLALPKANHKMLDFLKKLD